MMAKMAAIRLRVDTNFSRSRSVPNQFCISLKDRERS
jgi:hypothetical protein